MKLSKYIYPTCHPHGPPCLWLYPQSNSVVRTTYLIYHLVNTGNCSLIILFIFPVILDNLKVLRGPQNSIQMHRISSSAWTVLGTKEVIGTNIKSVAPCYPHDKSQIAYPAQKTPFVLPCQFFSFISQHCQYLPHQYYVPSTLNIFCKVWKCFILSLNLELCALFPLAATLFPSSQIIPLLTWLRYFFIIIA